MDYITKRYKEVIGSCFKPLGFRPYRNNFYRVVNDVFQSVHLHRSVSGDECTIEFVVAPLCVGKVIGKDYCGANHLKMFADDYSWFHYDRNDEASMERCVEEMAGYVKERLIPYFERSTDPAKAYREVGDFQEKHYKNGKNLADPYLFCMSLKAGLYENSLEHLKAQRAHAEAAQKRNKESFGDGLPAGYEAKIAESIRTIDDRAEKIAQRDLEFIDGFIDANEAAARANLGMK